MIDGLQNAKSCDLVFTTTIREENYLGGRLRVFENRLDGELFSEIFTLESLAQCLALSMSTVDGRYVRANLRRWMVPVRSMAG